MISTMNTKVWLRSLGNTLPVHTTGVRRKDRNAMQCRFRHNNFPSRTRVLSQCSPCRLSCLRLGFCSICTLSAFFLFCLLLSFQILVWFLFVGWRVDISIHCSSRKLSSFEELFWRGVKRLWLPLSGKSFHPSTLVAFDINCLNNTLLYCWA